MQASVNKQLARGDTSVASLASSSSNSGGQSLTQGQSFVDANGQTGIAQFDPNTGQRLSAGQSVTVNPISAERITNPIQPIQLPQTPTGTIGQSDTLLSSLGYTKTDQGWTLGDTKLNSDGTVDNTEQIFNRVKSLFPEPESKANLMQDVYGESAQQVADRQRRAEQEYSNIKNQILSVNNNALANKLSLQGQGRGIPEVVIGGQQAQIDKEATIQTLRLAPLLDAAAGDLESANKRLDQYFNALSDDMDSQYTYRKDVISTVMNYADKDQQRQLAVKDKQDDRNYSSQQSLVEYARGLAATAMNNGDNASASAFMELADGVRAVNIGSPTFEQDMAKVNSRISANVATMKQNPLMALNIENAKLTNEKLRKEIDSVGQPTKKEIEAEKAAMKTAKGQVQVLQDKITKIDYALEQPGLKYRVGPNKTEREGMLVGIPYIVGAGSSVPSMISEASGEGQRFAGAVHQIANKEFLDALIAAKAQGATFGALTDREGDALRASATAINDWEIKDKDGKGTGRWNIDEASFKNELNNIKELSQRSILNAQGDLLLDNEDDALNSLYSAQSSALAPGAYFNK